MNIKDIIELNIEKLTYGGECIGRVDAHTVFVPDTVAGDVVKAEVVSINKSFVRAVVKEIVSSSEQRVKPFCPLANVCGGCQWQHINYDEQLNAKKQIIEECMERIAGIEIPVRDVIRGDEIPEYRCKVQYPIQQTKNSKRFLVGYYKKGTHDIVNIKYCPIQPRIIDEVVEFLREKAQELKLSAYDEKKKKGLLRHFVFRYSQTKQNLVLTVVVNAKKAYPLIKELCVAVKNKFPEISGVLVNFNTLKSNLILVGTSELIEGNSYIEENLDGKKFIISADSFFQVNPQAAKKMFLEVRKIVEEKIKNPYILDVYAGSGSFSIFLSDLASKIIAVEESESSVKDGLNNLKLNNINNITFKKGNADNVLQNVAEHTRKPNLIVLDPPRKGCSVSVINSVKKIAPEYIIYVSCNPSTLARDVKLLSDNYVPEFIQPVDMFCHTYHVESILVLRRSNSDVQIDTKEPH